MKRATIARFHVESCPRFDPKVRIGTECSCAADESAAGFLRALASPREADPMSAEHDTAVVAAVAYRMQSEWKPEYEKVVRTALAVEQRGDWMDFLPPITPITESCEGPR